MTLNETTLLPLGAVAGCFVTMAGLTWYIATKFARLETRVSSQSKSLKAVIVLMRDASTIKETVARIEGGQAVNNTLYQVIADTLAESTRHRRQIVVPQ